MSIESIEPPAQLDWSVPCGICGNKNQLDSISKTGGQFLKSYADICRVHGALIGAIGVAEKQERNRP